MKYVTARRVTCSEDNETTHMVRACDKNGRRTITIESVTLSYSRRKKSESTTINIHDVHQRRRCSLQSKIKTYSKHTASSGTYKRLHGVDSCRHHHHHNAIDDEEGKRTVIGRWVADVFHRRIPWSSHSAAIWRTVLK